LTESRAGGTKGTTFAIATGETAAETDAKQRKMRGPITEERGGCWFTFRLWDGRKVSHVKEACWGKKGEKMLEQVKNKSVRGELRKVQVLRRKRFRRGCAAAGPWDADSLTSSVRSGKKGKGIDGLQSYMRLEVGREDRGMHESGEQGVMKAAFQDSRGSSVRNGVVRSA